MTALITHFDVNIILLLSMLEQQYMYFHVFEAVVDVSLAISGYETSSVTSLKKLFKHPLAQGVPCVILFLWLLPAINSVCYFLFMFDYMIA